MKFIIAIIVLVAVGVVAFQFDWFGAENPQEANLEDALFTVQRGLLNITVKEEGTLKAKNSLELKPEFRREGTISWLIEEGTEVKEGDILVEFEKTDVQNSIDEIENSLIQYETELEAAKANLAIQGRDNTANVESAVLALEMAKMDLEKYLQGEAPNQRRKLKIAVDKARSEFLRAQERYEQVPELLKEGFYTELQAEEEAIKVEEAEINQVNAEKDQELFEKFTYKMDVAQKEKTVKDAERTLENSTQKAEIETKEKEARVTRQERQVNSTQVRLDKTKKELVGMTMKAPQPGIVHYGKPEYEWERERIKIGERIWSGITVITLPDLREMQVMIQVHEADIDLVKVDQPVVATVESVKGVVFTGKVTKIASVASTNWSDSSNKRFKVDISLDPNEAKLRAGISAKVEIQVEEIPDVIHVPIHAVFAEGGEHFSFVRNNGDLEKRIVKIGKNNAHFVQIMEGLEEGEKVLLYDPRDSGLFGGKGDRSKGKGDGNGKPAGGDSSGMTPMSAGLKGSE